MRLNGRQACVLSTIAIFIASHTGCADITYLMQSAQGQLQLMSAREPIVDLIDNPQTAAPLAIRLREIERILHFAQQELALPDEGSYRHYVALDRAHVVYNVSAAPPLSLQPRRWCYPVVGCLSYRGYFNLRDASEHAAQLREGGDDVYVAPVQAYSTLGWFDDPLISSLLAGPSWFTASIIFHELSHQKVYLAGDTAFNEAYAVTVQQEGERRWLARYGTSQERAQFARYKHAQKDFLTLLRRTREQLKQLYDSQMSESNKLLEKHKLFEKLRAQFVQLRFQWGGYRGFDRWFSQDLNNAKMALVSTYNDLVPRFQQLLFRLNGDLAAFHVAVGQLSHLSPAARREALPVGPPQEANKQ